MSFHQVTAGKTRFHIVLGDRSVQVTGFYQHTARFTDKEGEEHAPLETREQSRKRSFPSLSVAIAHYENADQLTGGFGALIAELKNLQRIAPAYTSKRVVI